MTRFVSIVSRIEQGFSAIDWQEVGYILNHGLRAFVALTVLTVVYTVEGVQSFYRWAQPRLAAILEHPAQTIKSGPAALYTESVESVMLCRATIAEKAIVRVGAFVILTVDTISEMFADSVTLKVTMLGWIRYALGGKSMA
jgi:hypothetical protein